MPLKKLTDYLDNQKIMYVTISHSPAYTANEIAAAAHVPGKELAKTVMVKIDGKMTMAILPSYYKVNFDLLKEATGASKVELANEQDFKDKFPGCEIGAMPPFGNLYGMEVFVEKYLSEDKYISFNAGSHSELLRLSYKDFDRMVKPKVVKYAA